MKKAKLKAKMVENGVSAGELSETLTISKSTFYRKLNSGEDFTVGEATKIAQKLNLSADELTEIFLSA